MRNFCSILVMLILTACSTNVVLNGFVDPDYQNNYQVKKLLVIGSDISIGEKRILEDALKKLFVKYNAEFLFELEIFPPTRFFSNENIYQIAREKGIDVILFINTNDRGSVKLHIPPTYHPGRFTSYIYGNTINTYTEPGYVTGGFDINVSRINFKVHLINTKNKKVIWVAEGSTGDTICMPFSCLITDIAKVIIKELLKVGLISKKI